VIPAIVWGMSDTQVLAVQIKNELIALELDLAAHASVLQNSILRDHSGNLLDWKQTVQKHREDLDNSHAANLYSDIAKPIFSAKPECAELLRALLDLVQYQSALEQI
jgi:hypothetical protein